MADGTLLSALSGLRIAPLESPYGIGAQTLAQVTPQLINPYGSVGSNLGIALGSTLAQALLGYQARQEAAEQSLEATRYATQLMGATTPEARLGVLESVPTSGWYGPAIQQRLLGLNTQLGAQQQAINQQLALQRQLEDIKLETEQAKEFGVTRAQLPEALQRRQALRDALLGITPTAQPTAEGMVPNVAATAPAGLGAMDAQTALASPVVSEALTARDRDLLKARADLTQQQRTEIDKLRTEMSNRKEVKDFSYIDDAAKLINQAVKDPATVATQELVRRVVQIIEPGLAVREGEIAAVRASQNIPNELKGAVLAALTEEGGLQEPVREAILRIAERAYKQSASKYKTIASKYEDIAKQRGLDFNQINVLGEPTPWESIAGKKAASNRASQLQAILSQMQSTTDPTKIAQLKEQARSLMGQNGN